MNTVRFEKKRVLPLIIFIIYILISFSILTKFPFVHSDESWLSGLSRHIFENKDFSVTEPFFDLKERHPHAIKIIFHTLQIPFMLIFDYNIFAFRLISFIFGVLTIYIFYKFTKLVYKSSNTALIMSAVLAVDIQFIYASHFARQEIIMLFIFMSGLYYFYISMEKSITSSVILGSIIGISIGIHPNSFIISLPFMLIYVYHVFIKRDIPFRKLIQFITTLAVFASVFILISFYMNTNFIRDYISYGHEFSVHNSIFDKTSEIRFFYLKLFYSISGTYYTPNIKFQFILFALIIIFTLYLIFTNIKNNKTVKNFPIYMLLSFIGINCGIIAVGRFNQTSIIFIFPVIYVLIPYCINNLKFNNKKIIYLIIVISILNTIINIIPHINNDYIRYKNDIISAIPSKSKVISNLNSEYFFENNKLLDYRNLPFLKEKDISFKEYVRYNNIEYIVYTEELDLIYNSRPRWNGVYGNITYFYKDMKNFTKNDCKLVKEFTNKTYGVRIARFTNKKNWKIKIYKVINQ